eukprot:TRINITY_DN958_c0_g2_i8.p1 TRINITY_DN958_c0_g2~~TRINITY_DN958_c0_g2_i8.p1  ORF type:complete len:326 (+),score=67.95 TRINITY_DN958_c0_g2_i8:196-1173(+)
MSGTADVVPPLRGLGAAELRGRTHLLLGEGDFEFAASFAERHPWLCAKLIATDKTCRTRDPVVRKNINKLRDLGVCVGNLDAGKLPLLGAGAGFERVQFNCPCGDEKQPIPDVVGRVFAWCVAHLAPEGTLHVSCHGKQEEAQKAIALPANATRHGFWLQNVNNSLQRRYRYTAKRTSGLAFGNSSTGRVYEYAFSKGPPARVDYSVVNGAYAINRVETLPIEPVPPGEASEAASVSYATSEELEVQRDDFCEEYAKDFSYENFCDVQACADDIAAQYGEDDAYVFDEFLGQGCPGLDPRRRHSRFEIEEAADLYWRYSGGYSSD